MACPSALQWLSWLLLLFSATLLPTDCEQVRPYKFGSQLPGRHARWALKTTDLNRSLDFYRLALGMRILRHEEHAAGCPMMCNGPYETPWSRTVVGYEPEVSNFAIELVYNYGLYNYTQGESLQAIAIRPMLPVEHILSVATTLGYDEHYSDGGFELLLPLSYYPEGVGYKLEVYGNNSHLLTGPDDYRFLLLPYDPENVNMSEPFDHIRLRVRDLRASVDFYTRLLGMGEHTEAAIKQGIFPRPCENHLRVVGYSPPGGGNASGVPLLLEQMPNTGDPGAEPPYRVTPWDGRQYITIPHHILRIQYTWIWHYAPWSVVYTLQYAPKEANSTLLSAVIKDPDNNEILLASAEVFDQEVEEATNFAEPDWAVREVKELLAQPVEEVCEGLSTAGARCVFPFNYKGVIYNSCTRVDHDQPWCALTLYEPWIYVRDWDNCRCQPLCDAYKCPLSFPDPRPPLPPWFKYSEHPTEQHMLH